MKGHNNTVIDRIRGSRGGGGSGTPHPLEFAKLYIVDITRNETNIDFSYLCTSTVIRTSNLINPQSIDQITSVQDFLCLCNGFFLT